MANRLAADGAEASSREASLLRSPSATPFATARRGGLRGCKPTPTLPVGIHKPSRCSCCVPACSESKVRSLARLALPEIKMSEPLSAAELDEFVRDLPRPSLPLHRCSRLTLTMGMRTVVRSVSYVLILSSTCDVFTERKGRGFDGTGVRPAMADLRYPREGRLLHSFDLAKIVSTPSKHQFVSFR